MLWMGRGKDREGLKVEQEGHNTKFDVMDGSGEDLKFPTFLIRVSQTCLGR
jgi:hypothetical protein